ncbi:hypothetical protein [Deinococcus aerophilus]|uniref:Cell surface protein n=1 Tax=Deinococcus aerophilus TaxID=522488 RepID=A0ABQ2GZ93_9DEIO|nr:hypothetical protein [Deinococcus aerophilus]GGM21114.1 hypothetical protein GCM10010841_31340 [Deinococcus aerophilus]
MQNVLLSLTTLLTLSASVQAQATDLPLTIGPSPVTTTGHVAGQPTDLILMLPQAGNAQVPGLAFEAGGSITITLPPAFRRDEGHPINVAVPRGWPQADVCCYQASAVGNVLTITFTTPVRTDGPDAPGVKILAHIRGQAYLNPPAGSYPVTAQIRSGPQAVPVTASGSVQILATVPVARIAPTNFLLPRGENANNQTVALNRPAPALLSFLLWRGGQPLNGVGILPANTVQYPRYTGGLLVRDANGNQTLELPGDEVVGGIIGKAPEGATGQSALSPIGTDGKPLLSGQLSGYGTTVPVAGLLPVRFTVGNRVGAYQPTFELEGGNSVQITIDAVQP